MLLLIGLLVGLILGLTGAGGSILAVPLLMVGMGWAPAEAAPLSLLAVAVAAITGTCLAWSNGGVRWRAALLMGGLGWIAAPFGLAVARVLPSQILTAAFAVLLVVVGLRLIRQARSAPAEVIVVRAALSGGGAASSTMPCKVNPGTGRLIWTRRCAVAIAAAGTTAGGLSGLFGVGGGFLIVPVLRAVTDLSMHAAVATSLMTIAIVSVATFAISLTQGIAVAPSTAAWFAGASIGGMLLGRVLAARIAGARLQQGFAGLMLLAALGLAAQALLTH